MTKQKTDWYIIREKAKQWTAYELTAKQIKKLSPEFEQKGPYKSLLQCMMNQ